MEYPIMISVSELRAMVEIAERDNHDSVGIAHARSGGRPFMTFTENIDGVINGLTYDSVLTVRRANTLVTNA